MKKIITILLLTILCGCASQQTAIIYCKRNIPVEYCVQDQLGKKVKIIKVEKIDNSVYMVDYK